MEGKRKFERFVIKTGSEIQSTIVLAYLKRLGLRTMGTDDIYTKGNWLYSNTDGHITYGMLTPTHGVTIRNIPNTEFLNNFKW